MPAVATLRSETHVLRSSDVAAVIQLRPRARKQVEQYLPPEVDLTDLGEVTRFVAAEIRQSHYKNMNRIAFKTGLCFNTVSKIAAEETKFPRWATVVAILKALGYRVYARKG